jgi:hypothetical protein
VLRSASLTIVVGVVYEEILKGPALLLAPVVKKCHKLLKESEGDIQKNTAKLIKKKDRRLFGVQLEDYLAEQKMTDPGLFIPLFVIDAVQYILRHGNSCTAQ